MQVQESLLRINLQLNVGNFKLHRMLSQHDFFETVDDLDGGTTLMGQEKGLDVQDLFTIAELLKEEEDQDLFRCDEFCLEWLMLLVLWTSFIIGLSWAFVVIEADNYDLIIQENHDIKLLLDNAVPVRDKLEVVLTALASCEGNSSEEAYNLLADVSTEYNNPNVTMWNELDSLLGAYTFHNPWTFEGSTFFSVTIATTIGYGTFTPLTSTGKQIVIFSSLPAIYLTIVFGQKNMELLQKGFCRTQYESLGLMGFFSIIFLLSFMIVGGWILANSEGWTMWDSIYFCWVSFSTIGFGDYAPVVGEEWNVVFLSLVVVGWNIVIFVISVIEKLSKEFKEMSWWNENKFQPMATIANTLRIEQKAASNLIGVAQVVYSANSSSAAELSLEIEKCEQRLLHLKQEQKNLALKDECERCCRPWSGPRARHCWQRRDPDHHQEVALQVRDAQVKVDEESAAKSAAADAKVTADRRAAAVANGLEEARALLETADRQRRAAEQELADTNETLADLTNVNQTITASKRKLESEFNQLGADLDEMTNEARLSEDKAARAMVDAARLADELRCEQDVAMNLEKDKKLLEAQCKDAGARADEAEVNALKEGRKAMIKMETRIRELESELDAESRRNGDVTKNLRKSERSIKELTFAADEDRKNHERMQALIDQLQGKVKSYKKQIEEAEEIAALNLAKYRKVAGALGDAEAAADQSEQVLARMKARGRSASLGPMYMMTLLCDRNY